MADEQASHSSPAPQTFAELAASRRQWIDQILKPWCVQAAAAELRLAELEWLDIAGRADAAGTLWTWAWGRFPAIVHDELPGLNETYCVEVVTRSGECLTGFPDARQSERGKLVLLGKDSKGALVHLPAVSIDDITAVLRQDDAVAVSPETNR